jgi:putative transposase
MAAVAELAATTDTATACRALGIGRATWYRHRQPRPNPERQPGPKPTWALSPADRAAVLDVLHEPRFVDKAPAEIVATLLDEGRYLCSERTMYRVLAAADEVRERRNQLRHPWATKPELVATAPNQVWSWDITKLRTTEKWHYYALYVVLDIYSRYIVGWTVALRESATLATRLISESCRQQGVARDQLTLHADRGSAMTSKTLAELLIDLGVAKSHSRPHVSNDNAYSEANFKTLKYRPEFPERFGPIEHARAFCRQFVAWYNHDHRHAGIGMLTPADVHTGRAEEVIAARHRVMMAAYAANPTRFRRPPARPNGPIEAWINRPNPTPAPELS